LSFFVTFFRIAPLIRGQLEGRATRTKNDGGFRQKWRRIPELLTHLNAWKNADLEGGGIRRSAGCTFNAA
jgi:hypothetical protein